MTPTSMKPTERYAAVALLLLVALVTVVGFWDTGESSPPSPEGGTLAGAPAVRVEESARPESQGAVPGGAADRRKGAERGTSPSVPLSGAINAAPQFDKVSTRRLSSAGHRVTPGAPSELDRGTAPTVRVEKHAKVAQSSEQLSGALRPAKKRGGDSFDLTAGGAKRGASEGAIKGQPFLSRNQRSASNEAAGNGRMAAVTSVQVAKTRQQEASERKKAASDPSLLSYEVKSGDALSRIARRECGSDQAVAEIVRLNGLVDSDIILTGMILKIPSRASVQAKVASALKAKPSSSDVASGSSKAVPSEQGGRRKIRIQSGEVLGAVLERELGTFRRSIALVREMNPGLDPNFVQVGQIIVLPDRSEIPVGKSTKSPSRIPSGPLPASSERSPGAPRLAANSAPRTGSKTNSQFYVR